MNTIFPTVTVGGVPFAATSLDEASEWLLNMASRQSRPGGVAIRLANAWCVVVANESPSYKSLLVNSGINFPDGSAVAWRMRRTARGATAGRVRGPSFFVRVMDKGRPRQLRHFLLGSTTQTLAKLGERLTERFPGVIITGTYSPPFGPVDSIFLDRCVQAVLASGADIVWVGLGSPKQDFVSQELARRLDLPCCGVGAAFDFVAGTAREAPLWIQKSGFEWLYRLSQEPRRLWRRYALGNVKFLWYSRR